MFAGVSTERRGIITTIYMEAIIPQRRVIINPLKRGELISILQKNV